MLKNIFYKALLACLCLLTMPSHASVNYTFENFNLTNGYAFSGTITTDGSTGNFTSASAITDYTITLITPDEVDGISEQVLTPSNSALTLDGDFVTATLQITATEIRLTPDILDDGIVLSFFASGNNERLIFLGASNNTGPNINIQDISETPSIGVVANSLNDTLTIATVMAITEPTAVSVPTLPIWALLVSALSYLIVSRKLISR